MRSHRLLLPTVAAAILLRIVHGQTASPPADKTAGDTAAPEVASHEEQTTFKSKVNLVLVPVIVRDSSGRAVGNLRKEDFQLLDKGRPQVISRFTVEHPGSHSDRAGPEHPETTVFQAETPAPIAERFTAYVFDDIHTESSDLFRSRDAAIDFLDTAWRPGDRAGVFTTSGQTTHDFTDDHLRLRETLRQLRPHSIAAKGIRNCPDVSFYMADLIENKHDPEALRTAAAEARDCLQLKDIPQAQQIAEQQAHSAAAIALQAGEHESNVSLTMLQGLVDRMSVLPGQRNVVLASSGFFTPDDLRSRESELMERALRASVVINALDARGLYTANPAGDIDAESTNAEVARRKSEYFLSSARMDSDILAELAAGTGGAFFQNNNDLKAGFLKLAAAPEYMYLLGFSPDNLKTDGTFHQLKVKLTAAGRFDLQTRRGYFAPRHAADPADAVKEEIQEAVFSREERHDLPVELHTQFFKVSDTDANVSVLARVTLRQMHFRKADGRNHNQLTVVSALFDRNGNFVKASEQTVQMRLRDQTLIKTPAITVKSDFDVPPGDYVVRLVVRDAEGQNMAAANGAVEIPF